MKERRYIAISIKHSEGCRFTLWGYRTADDQERCFAGYSSVGDYDKCELYSLEDFQNNRGNGVIKCNESVKMSRDMVEKWNHYDTVLVDYQDYKNFLRDELGYVIEEGNKI